MSLILDQKFKIVFGYTGVAGQPELHESLYKNKQTKKKSLTYQLHILKKERINLLTMSHTKSLKNLFY